MDLSQFLKTVEILSDLNEQEVSLLAADAEIFTYPSQGLILERGDIGRSLWIVYDGSVEISLQDTDGRVKVLASLERGSIFGEMSIMTGEPAGADVKAAQPCKVVRIPRETFSKIVASNPKTLGKFTRMITKRLFQNEMEEQKALKDLARKENDDPYDLNFSSVSEPMKILVINCGSSSLKYSLFDTAKREPLIEGLVEKIGSGDASHKIKTVEFKRDDAVPEVMNMEAAFDAMIHTISDARHGAIKNLSEIKAVGHRVVHGGSDFSSSVVINEKVTDVIKSLFALAPLHNPYNLEGIEMMKKLLPDVPQVAAFDTSFHMGMPDKAYTYALPFAVCEAEHIRRYGFHGTNHRFVALSAATFLKRPVGELKVISCHLGSGCSICAIDHGQSIDTSMGLTPLEGLVMSTRAGDIDPGIILHLMRHSGMSADEVDKMLNKDSGLKGITGKSNDMRTILQAAEAGDLRCKLAIGTFCYRVRKYIGSYIAALGGLDALIFTGGIGENSIEIRARICQGLETFGITLFDDINRQTRAQRGKIVDVSEPGSRVRILVVPADEEKMIARETIHALGRVITKEDVQKFRSRPIPLSTSAHHIHLSQVHFETLFGKGRTMTPKSELSQPGQFAAAEVVNLVGPKGRIEHVRILGPARRESQVEIARTEQFTLGIDAPIRDSGDIEGTPGLIIEGDVGKVKLEKGVICAKRHIHMSPEEALLLGLRDRDVVMVKVKGVRELIYGDVLVRVHPDFRMDMHLDTDEANAAQISEGVMGYIDAIQHRHYV
ncbi:MAG: acetate/propionate family kinase [Deltaproteobacteria bacterium]|nr:acetate/propionate family kinase [Deltaproteobacteria bacterium]